MRYREEQVSDYPFSRPRMTNTNWLSSTYMSLLDHHTRPERTVETAYTVADYVSNYEGVGLLDMGRFASIKEGPSRLERGGHFIILYCAWMARRYYWSGVPHTLRVKDVANMPWVQRLLGSIIFTICVTSLMTQNKMCWRFWSSRRRFSALFLRWDDCYRYSGWMGWIDYMFFERLLRHRNKRPDSLFYEWY